MNLNPTWCAGYILAVILSSPSLNKAHTNGTHLSQLVDRFKAVVDRLGEKSGKLLIVEDFQAASWRDLADCGRMESVAVIAVTTLHKDAAVAQTFCIHFTTHIVQMDTCKPYQKNCHNNLSKPS